MRLVFASGNSGKLEEVRAVLGSKYEVLSIKDLEPILGSPAPAVEEVELTYRGNAQLKADAIYEWCGLPSLADDSGLEVLALDRRPGLYSARYAGVGSSSEDNINKVLGELEQVDDRRAQLVCSLCLRLDSRRHLFAEGRIDGVILRERQGQGGFGYDPLFYIEAQQRTIAEIKADKNDFATHRGAALRLLEQQLAESKN
mgnify:CR=1 FL=1